VKYLLLMSLAIIVSACSSTGPSLTSMNELELVLYNRERPPEEHVYCVKEADTSSFIRKRSCRTYKDWIAHNERAWMYINVLNTEPNRVMRGARPR